MYSASVEMPADIMEVTELYFMAAEYYVTDLISRCQSEILNNITSSNVTDLLVKFFQAHRQVLEDESHK